MRTERMTAGDATNTGTVIPLGVTGGPALCGGCDRRAEEPQVRSCTRSDCPMREKEAA
jgi:hypothetical protein